jgi:hypothetical protein
MPYFLCPACALSAYSAAGESRCPACDTPLRRFNQVHPPIPRAESLRDDRARPHPLRAKRFRWDSRSAVRDRGQR